MLNYTSSSGVGFANMQKLGASLHAGTLQFLGGYVLGFFNAIGVMLTSVDHARLRLNALVLQHPCEPYGQLLHRIGRHYIYQASQAAAPRHCTPPPVHGAMQCTPLHMRAVAASGREAPLLQVPRRWVRQRPPPRVS